MDGLELCIRFSYVPNWLRYCGPGEAHDKFLTYLKDKSYPEAVSTAFSRFEGLYPYLEAIAKATGKKPTDYEVVEAYWLGNALLERAGKVMPEVLDALMKRGLPRSIGEKLKQDLPHDALPHHLFHVIYTGVGQTSGKVETSHANMDKCRISWGTVTRIGETITVLRMPLLHDERGYHLGKAEQYTASYHPELIQAVSVGDIVAMHWESAVMKLDPKQLANLQDYSQRVLDAINSRPARTS